MQNRKGKRSFKVKYGVQLGDLGCPGGCWVYEDGK